MDTGFEVRLTPRAGRDSIDGVGEDGALRVRVAGPPVKGAANRDLVRLLAAALDVAPSAVSIDAGARSRRKRLTVSGVDARSLRARWPGLQVTRVDAVSARRR